MIRGGAIGDFILTLPVLAALRGQFPDAAIEVLGYPKVAQLAVHGGLADAIQPIEARPMAGFFARNGTLAPELQDYFAGFALIISFLYDPDSIFQENVGRCSKAQFIVGPHRPDEALGLHATKVFLEPLERLAIFEADPKPCLHLPEPDKQISEVDWIRAGPALALHPGSGSERKNWPEERWGELLVRLSQETRLRFLLVGGEAEGEKLKRLAVRVSSERCVVADSIPLPRLAFMLQNCAGFLGHDSGITHLAAAVGLAGLALWGPSNEKVWHPVPDRIQVVKPVAGLASLTAEQVFRATLALDSLRLAQANLSG